MKISMRDESSVMEVINLCTSLEEKALHIYETLAGLSSNEKMKKLWTAMVQDEKEHRDYWRRLKEVCADGGVPEVFDEPKKYVDELQALQSRIDHLAARVRLEYGPPDVFIHALRLEFLLLHPSFVTLFHYLPDGPGGISPSHSYEQHLGRILTALMDYEELPPELELLGEMIGQVWKKSEEGATKAVTDSLTGALNRRGLYIAMKPLAYLARREKQTAGVMIMEIDNLRRINEAGGHRKGDEMLTEAAKLISSRLRASDVIGRFGGDDFLVLLTRFDKRHFEEIGREMVRRVGAMSAGDHKVSLIVGGSFTVMGDDVEQTVEKLIRKADRALDEARAGAKGCVVHAL